jgi:stage III sporulation protein AF
VRLDAADFYYNFRFGGDHMIEGLRIWLLGVIAAAFVTAILDGLLPKTAAGTIGKVAGGLILLLALLRPVGGVEAGRLSGLYDGYASEIDKQIEVYRHSNQTEMAEIIEQETAAYISKKQRHTVCVVRYRWRPDYRTVYLCPVRSDCIRKKTASFPNGSSGNWGSLRRNKRGR